MTDTKITNLTELGSTGSGDLLPVVDGPAGTPQTKKVKVANLVISSYNFKDNKVYLDEGGDSYIWYNSSNGKIELVKGGALVQRW